MLSFERADLWWLAFLLAGLSLALLRLQYAFPASQGLRRILALLRTSAVSLLLLALLQPSVSCSYSRKVRPELAVLVDTSLSMSVPTSSGKSRLAAALDELDRISPVLDRFNLRTFAFGSRLRTVPDPKDLKPEDPTTDFRQAVLALRRSLPHSLRGVLLLSDGAFELDHTTWAALRDLKNRGVPVIPIPIPGNTSGPDSAVRIIPPPSETIHLNRPATVEVELLTHPPSSTPITVSLAVDDKPEASKTLSLPTGRGVVRFPYTPTSVGVRRLTVTVSGRSEDAFPANNRDTVLLRVIAGERTAVLLAGQASWEYAFLKRQLESDASLKTLSAFRKGDSTLIPPAGSEKADLVVLCGITADDLPPSFWARLRERLQAGRASLLLLAGPAESIFSQPAKNPDLTAILPFEPSASPPLRGSFPVQTTPQGASDPVMLLDDSPSRNSRLWSGLPPFTKVHRIRPKPTVTVLATAGNTPVMGLDAGRRVFFIAASATWRWAFLNLGVNDDHERYRLFYRRLVQNLLASTSPPERLSTEHLNHPSDRPVRIVAHGTRDPTVTWQGPHNLSGRVRLSPSATTPGRLEGSFLPPADGDYTLRTAEGDTARIRVGRTGDELFDIRPSPANLERIGQATGNLRPQNLDPTPVTRSFRRRQGLQDSLLLLLLVTTLLSTEWILRKTRGWP